MTSKHWLLVAGFIGAVGAQLSTAASWHVIIETPLFAGSLLAQFAIFLTAMFTEKPNGSDSTRVPTILLALVLSGGLLALPACATLQTTTPQTNEDARIAETLRIVSAAETVVGVVKAAQSAEIGIYRTQMIKESKEMHVKIETAFVKFGQATKIALTQLDTVASSDATRRTAAQAIFDAAKEILQSFKDFGPGFEGWVAALQGVLVAAHVL